MLAGYWWYCLLRPLTEAKASLLGPDSHGLTMLPFPSGERAPGWNLEATAAMVGLTRATTREQVYRAALEAVALRLGSIIKLMGGGGQSREGGRGCDVE